MSRGTLTRRGFRPNRHIQGFTGYCGTCRLYRPIDWWSAPEVDGRLGGEVCVCSFCGAIDPRDDRFVRSYPKKGVECAA